MGLVSIILAYGLALVFGKDAATWITQNTQEIEDGTALIGFIAVFIVALIALILAGRALRKVLRASPLGLLDSVLGCAIGLAKGVLALGLLIMVLYAYPFHSRIPGMLDSAALGPPVQRTALVLADGFQALFPRAEDLTRLIKNLNVNASDPPPIVDKIKSEAQEAKDKLNLLIDESRDRLESNQ